MTFLYYALSMADDANQPWMPAGLGSDEKVREALVPFEAWARRFATARQCMGTMEQKITELPEAAAAASLRLRDEILAILGADS